MATPEAVCNNIFAAASENSDLLNTLAKTADGPSLYRAHLTHLSHLETTLEEQRTALESLRKETEERFKKHRKLRDGGGKGPRRWWYIATHMLGKLEGLERMGMEEEREYFSVLGERGKCEDKVRLLEAEVESVKTEGRELEELVKVHENAHARIDTLYERLFKGPTPGFGDEDIAEHRFFAAEQRNEQVKEGIRRCRRAKSGLGTLKTYLGRTEGNLRFGFTSAEESFFFFDQAIYFLGRANTALELAVKKVREMEEFLLPLPGEMDARYQTLITGLEVAMISTDRLYSKDMILSAIEAAQDSLKTTGTRVDELIEYTKEVEKAGLAEIRISARLLEDARQDLQQIRQGVFERVAGFGEAAPAYNECCDRAEGFCAVTEVGCESVHPEEEAAPPLVGARGNAPPGYEDGKVTRPSRFGLADVLREDGAF